jgi:anti-sigma factor RsiW
MSACVDKLLLIHALADGEVDAANAVAIEAHLAACAACRAEYDRIMALRLALTRAPLRHAAPAGVARGVAAMLDAQEEPAPAVPPRAARPGVVRHIASRRWLSGAVTGLAAGLLLAIALPRTPATAPGEDLVAGHVRSLMARHLTDVAATDKHVVKPWFNGRLDFAPPVPNLDADGFPLAGGRLDVVGGRDAAALVYRRRLHVINVFVAPAGAGLATGGDDARDGFNILRWRAGGLEFAAVSDLNGKELRQFRELFRLRAKG